MKQLLSIALLLSLTVFGCSKTKDTTLKYPKTELVGTTWKKFSFKGSVSNKDVYEFIYFKSSSQLEIYSAEIDGTNMVGSKDSYPYSLKLSDKNMDSFEVSYPNGQSGVGFTTHDKKTIQYNGSDYTSHK